MQPVNYLQQWKEDVLTSISQSGRIRTTLKWADNCDDAFRHQLVRESSYKDLNESEEKQIVKVDNHKKEFHGKSILKGRNI